MIGGRGVASSSYQPVSLPPQGCWYLEEEAGAWYGAYSRAVLLDERWVSLAHAKRYDGSKR